MRFGTLVRAVQKRDKGLSEQEEILRIQTFLPLGWKLNMWAKLDTAAPAAGVSGERVLLGKARFTHAGLTLFDLSLDYGKRGPANEFKNFVATDEEVLDDAAVAFGTITVKERSDANGDGVITNMDMFEVKGMLSSGVYKCYADCNDDGVITNMDMFCIKGKL